MKKEKLFVRRHLLKKSKMPSEAITKLHVMSNENISKESSLRFVNNEVGNGILQSQTVKKNKLLSRFNSNNNGKHNHSSLNLETETNEVYLKRDARPKNAFKPGKHKVKYGPVLSPTAKKAGFVFRGRSSSSGSRRLSSATADYDELMRQSVDHVTSVMTSSPGRSTQRVSYKKAIQKAGYNMNDLVSADGATGSLSPRRDWPVLDHIDWTDTAMSNHHVWAPSSASGDVCYVGEDYCQKSGPRKRCSACHIVVHENCLDCLEKISFSCKATFREFTSKSMRESLVVHHHWVHRRKLDGKCKQCGKSFEKKFAFREPTKIVAISCSWCKEAYHNKVQCFQLQKISEPCTLGSLSKSIVPSTWIIKRSPRNRSKKRRSSTGPMKKRSSREGKPRLFVVRPLSQQAAFACPTLVFINPKSGGRQGAKLLQAFQWLMNPRQVFDLSLEGPQEPLDLYRKVPNLRVLACGGDGTVGWILSTLDKLEISKPPAVAILPLGTGNDLSRTLNFGHGYVDEPVHKIIQGVEEARVVKLDRWKLTVEKNEEAVIGNDDEDVQPAMASYYNAPGAPVDQPPLDVVNNYFSIGSDAQVALRFHESREAHPAKFTSRFGNKFFYVRAGLLEYLTRQSKDLSKHVSVVCDGKDITQKICDLKPVCLLFLNIPNFSSGTSPWGHPTGTEFNAQSHDDKLIEVLAFSINQLGMLFVGGHGERLCQCRTASIKTTKAFPVQIDGEPCKLNPSKIKLEFFNQASMLCKTKRRVSALDYQQSHEQIKIRVNVVLKEHFETYLGAKTPLSTHAMPLLVTVVMNQSTLDSVRSCLHLIICELERPTGLISKKWFFLDSSKEDKFYKIDKNRESHLIVGDVITSDREVYILDASEESAPKSVSHLSTSADKHSVLRNRIRSDSVLQSSSSHYSSDNHQSVSTDEGKKLNGSPGSMIAEPASASLDVVFELPEVTDVQQAGVEVIVTPGLKSSQSGDEGANESKSPSINDARLYSPSLSPLQVDARLDSDSSSYSTSSNEYILTENSNVFSPLRKPPLITSSPPPPAIDYTLPPIFATQLSLDEESPRKIKQHKRSNTDTDAQKSASFNLSPSQLLSTMRHNKNQSNNIIGAVSGLVKINSFNVSKRRNNRKISLDDGVFTSKSGQAVDWNKTFIDASKRGDVQRMKLALARGARIDARDAEGCTALHHAARHAHDEALDFLVETGDVSFVNMTCAEKRQTALHVAAWFNRAHMCRKLLEAGASLQLTDYKSMNAVDKAKQADAKELLEVFALFKPNPSDHDTVL